MENEVMTPDDVSDLLADLQKQAFQHLAYQRERFAAQNLDKFGRYRLCEYPGRLERTETHLELVQEVVLVPNDTPEPIGSYEEASQHYTHEQFRSRISLSLLE